VICAGLAGVSATELNVTIALQVRVVLPTTDPCEAEIMLLPADRQFTLFVVLKVPRLAIAVLALPQITDDVKFWIDPSL
jgi:hypothetical protein